ncbi:neuronal acetylcholine receptor subunit beta-2-like [Convolutriloba macropyga]|uniref:neuronal acetylcholine receptor subunit beta-2-like n=1 Tax=Convolutriloba macropyga TaxID=536237 RepID=UPI003F5221C7
MTMGRQARPKAVISHKITQCLISGSAKYTRWDDDLDPHLLLECPECLIEHKLLPRLSRLYPPRGVDGGPLEVSCKIVIKELMEMSVKAETLQIMAWIRLIWYDYSAAWDPDIFDIHEVRLVPKQIWVPDMMISNSLSNFEIYRSDSNLPVIVGFDGFRYWSVPVIINTKCTADVTFFPFDMQFCKIKLNSWTYHEKILKLKISEFETGMEGHVGNIEWTIVHVKGYLLFEPPITNHPLYVNESIEYTYIEYRMALKRKPDFYVNTLVVPSLLLSWLGAVIFLLPSECGEKLSFSITLFLALYINQVIVSEFLPPSADTYPLIAKFYMLISIILGGSIFLTAVILMFHFRLNHATPVKNSLAHKLFMLLEKIGSISVLGLGRKTKTTKRSRPKSSEKFHNSYVTRNSTALVANYIELAHNENVICDEPVVMKASPKEPNRLSSVKQPRSNFSTPVKEPNNSAIKTSSLKLCGVNKNGNGIITSPGGCVTSSSSCAMPTEAQIASPSGSISSPSAAGVTSSKGILTSPVSNKRRVIGCSPKIEEYLKEILEKLDIVAKDDTAEVSLKRWRTLASGLDRIFFLSYLVIMGITTLYFFLLVLSIEKVKNNMDFDSILDGLDQ